MALVSSISPSPSPYDLASSPYAKSPEPLQIRALPTLPAGSTAAVGMGSSYHSVHGDRDALGASSTSPGSARRPLPGPAPVRSPSAPPFLERRPPSSTGSVSPAGHSPAGRSPQPSPTPRAHSGPSHAPTLSSSSSPASVPRLPLPTAHLAPGSAPQLGGSHNPSHPFSQSPPSPYTHFPSPQAGGAPFHHYPNPAYPFIPSPHPHAGYQGPGPYSPGFGDQQRLMQAQAQAQFQQQQAWQMEMMRGQSQQPGLPGGSFDWAGQQAQGQNVRRRATSGPAPPKAHSPQPPPFFPPSALHFSPNQPTGYSQQYTGPSYPQGAMLLSGSGQGHGGYPTPPASVEGSRDSSKDGYHPYRRGAPGQSQRSSTLDDVAMPNKATRALPMPGTGHQANKSSSSSLHSSGHGRRESMSLSIQNFPPLPASSKVPSPSASSVKMPSPSGASPPALYGLPNPSHTKSGSTSSVNSTNARSNQSSSAPFVNGSGTRARTDSSHSAHSSLSSVRPSRERTDSSSSSRDGSVRSPTPTGSSSATAAAGKKPSPLSRVATPPPGPSSSSSHDPTTPRPGTPGTIRGGAHDDEDSDDTAGAVVVVVDSSTTTAAKDKKKSKWKKAFSLSTSTSSASSALGPALTDAELDGRGAKVPQRMRSGSVSSEESEALPRTPPTAGGSRPPSSSGRRFGILNSKLNSSTDNISISSTVSSASVMIRKLGQMGGKLARRNSLMSLTKAFKSNKDDKDGVVTVDPSAPPKAGKKDKGDKKKSQLASASVSHATAEIESSQTAGMSPAAALAKKHQLQYAEQEAAQAAAQAAQLAPPRSFTVHARTDSNASDASAKAPGRSWGRSKTTDDVVESGAAAARALEKEKDTIKSRKAKKWNVFGSRAAEGPAEEPESDETPTPRASVELLSPTPQHAPLPYSSYGESYLEFGPLESPSALGEDEYEPSDVGGTPPVGHRREARTVRGILKGAGTYNQEDFANPRANFPRHRASSFDAPQQTGRPGSPGNTVLGSYIPSEAQVDGVVSSSILSRSDPAPPSPTEVISPPSMSSPYANPSLNASAPVITRPFGGVPLRSASTPGGSSRHIIFAPNLSIHTTWPAAVYDRRAEPSTSNRLTPALAQRIKEELNAFKMEEMEVHPGSRQLTHFFV